MTARLATESALSLGWECPAGRDGSIIAIDRFDASARGETLFVQLGLSVEHTDQPDIVARWNGPTRFVRRILGSTVIAVSGLCDAFTKPASSVHEKSNHRSITKTGPRPERLARRTTRFSFVPERGFRAVGRARVKCQVYVRVRPVTGFCRNLP